MRCALPLAMSNANKTQVFGSNLVATNLVDTLKNRSYSSNMNHSKQQPSQAGWTTADWKRSQPRLFVVDDSPADEFADTVVANGSEITRNIRKGVK